MARFSAKARDSYRALLFVMRLVRVMNVLVVDPNALCFNRSFFLSRIPMNFSFFRLHVSRYVLVGEDRR